MRYSEVRHRPCSVDCTSVASLTRATSYATAALLWTAGTTVLIRCIKCCNMSSHVHTTPVLFCDYTNACYVTFSMLSFRPVMAASHSSCFGVAACCSVIFQSHMPGTIVYNLEPGCEHGLCLLM